MIHGDVPPRGAYVRDLIMLVDVPAASVPAVWTVAKQDSSMPCTFEVPPQQNGIVRYFGLDTNAPAGETFIRFRFTVNGAVVLNYQSPPINIGDVDDPCLVHLDLRPGDLFNVELTNLDDTIAYTVSLRVFIWCTATKLLQGRA